MYRDDYLEDLSYQIGQTDFQSVRTEIDRTIRAIRRAGAIQMTDVLKKAAVEKAPAQLQNWNLPEKAMTDGRDPHLLEQHLVQTISKMKVPGGALWIEPEQDEEYTYLPADILLLENTADGVKISAFFYEDSSYFLPMSTVVFRPDGTIKAEMTAIGVEEARDFFSQSGPAEVIDHCTYVLHDPLKTMFNHKELLAAAWLAAERDPEFLSHICAPLERAALPATPHQVLSRIHPQRIFEELPGLVDAKISSKATIDRRDLIKSLMGMIGGSLNTLISNYAVWTADLPVELRPENPVVFTRGVQELLATISGFERGGSHVFHLNGNLSEVLGQTELSGITCNDIRLPHDRLYLSYEERIPFPVNGENLVFEGAYVSKTGSHEIELTMVVKPEGPKGHPILDFRTPISIRLDLSASLSLEDAMIEAIGSGGYNTDPGAPVVISDEVREAALGMGISVSPVGKPSSATIAGFHEDAFPAVVDALRIVGNSLLMLGSRPEQILQEDVWPGASKETLYQLQAPSPKGKERGRRMAELEGVMGYRILSLDPKVEQRIREEVQERRGSPSVAYWRRGFWRQQAHGPGRSLRKLTWVEPTLCNEKAGLIAQGSLYELGKPTEEGPEGP